MGSLTTTKVAPSCPTLLKVMVYSRVSPGITSGAPGRLTLATVLDASSPGDRDAFVAGITSGYECYGVLLDCEEDFARYLGMQYHANALYYLFRRAGHSFAAVYAIGPCGRILTRKHLFTEDEIRDILWTFGPCLGGCDPYDLVCEIDPDRNEVKTMKGRVLSAVQL